MGNDIEPAFCGPSRNSILNRLSRLNYVAGCVFIFAACEFIFLYVIVFSMSDAPVSSSIAIARLILGLSVLVVGIITIRSGWLIAHRRKRNFSVAAALIQCLVVPLGPILGIHALIVLSQERIKAQYNKSAIACQQCGYDLRGTPARCPECGTVPFNEGQDK